VRPESPQDDRLLAGLQRELTRLGTDLRLMAEARWELARVELRASIYQGRRLAILLVIGGILVLASLPVAAVAASQFLAQTVGMSFLFWLIIWAVGLATGGIAIAWSAWRRFRRDFVGIEETLEELREDLQWLQDFRTGGGISGDMGSDMEGDKRDDTGPSDPPNAQ
jgi:NADH:ubiquinone oxidoreductase subunit K